MVLGTYTSENEPNHLMIARVRLPKPDVELDVRQYDEERGGESSSAVASARVYRAAAVFFKCAVMQMYLNQTCASLPLVPCASRCRAGGLRR